MDDLKEFADSFWTRYAEMENGQKYVERIEKGEAEIEKINDIEVAIFNKFTAEKAKNPKMNIDDISIDYTGMAISQFYQSNIVLNKRDSKSASKMASEYDFSAEEDKFIAYCLYKYGYNNWNLINNEVRGSSRFMFNWKFMANNTKQV